MNNEIVLVNVFYEATTDDVFEKFCKVCNSLCDIEKEYRKVIPGLKNIALDRFTCPHNDKDWHWKTLAMMQELEDTSSPSLRKIIQQDINSAIYDGLQK